MKTSKPKNTREKVRTAAWQLIEEGISPSRTKIRDRIGPGGSDATVADELHCFWTELGEHVKQSKARPDIPVEFITAFNEVLEQARTLEAQRWETERRELSEKAELAEKERLKAINATESAQDAHSRVLAELQETQEKLSQANGQIHRLEQLQKQLSERTNSLQEQIKELRQKERDFQCQKEKEIELAYERARETEERLTKLYDEQRMAYEKAAAELQSANENLSTTEKEKLQLEQALKETKREVSLLETNVADLAEAQVQLQKLEKENVILSSQLESCMKREKETRQALDMKIGQLTRAEVELTAAKEAMRKMKEKQHKNKNLKASRKNEVSISEEQNKQ